jgi:hypothetical protein
MATHRGRCHCGNVELELDTALELAALPLRACACEFCRRHGARTTSDPHGRARIVVHDAALLGRYRFALATADVLVCTRCGVYVGALLEADDGAWATLNTNAFVDAPPQLARVVRYDDEDAAARSARRRASWTPCTLVVGPAPGG